LEVGSLSLTFDQRTYLIAANHGHLFDNANGRPVIQAMRTLGNVLRVNARVTVVEQLIADGWIVRGSDYRYQLTDVGRAQLPTDNPEGATCNT
jgi:hypothetical protein